MLKEAAAPTFHDHDNFMTVCGWMKQTALSTLSVASDGKCGHFKVAMLGKKYPSSKLRNKINSSKRFWMKFFVYDKKEAAQKSKRKNNVSLEQNWRIKTSLKSPFYCHFTWFRSRKAGWEILPSLSCGTTHSHIATVILINHDLQPYIAISRANFSDVSILADWPKSVQQIAGGDAVLIGADIKLRSP